MKLINYLSIALINVLSCNSLIIREVLQIKCISFDDDNTGSLIESHHYVVATSEQQIFKNCCTTCLLMHFGQTAEVKQY